MKHHLVSAAACLSLIAGAACDSTTAAGGNEVRIRMGARSEIAAGSAAEAPLVIAGTNGELTITDLRVVVAEFEVKGDDDVNPCAAAGRDDDCEDFDAGPLFLDIPLNAEVTVSTGALPAGTYREVEFEVEDLDDDEDEPAKAARIQALLEQIRAQLPDWPRKASLLVVGSFRPTSGGTLGAPVPFRVFVEAELETEVQLVPPLVVGAGGAQEVSITFDPTQVFRTGTQVVDLSQFNGRLLEWRIDTGFRGTSRGSGSGS